MTKRRLIAGQPCLPQRPVCIELCPGKMMSMSDTQLTQDGLRYVKKAPGSIITTPRAESMMSCFKCGKFKLPSEMAMKRFLGKTHRVCAPKCS